MADAGGPVEVTAAPPDDPHPGSDAVSPGDIPARGWRIVLGRVARRTMTARIPFFAAGVAFFAVLSIAPVLVAALSVYGAINTPAQALDQLSEMTDLLPPELEPLVAEQLTTITTASGRVLTRRGATGLAIALWTATTAAMCLIDALTIAYHETETRGFLRRLLLALGFVLGGAVLLGAVITTASFFSRWLQDAPSEVRAVAPSIGWLTLALLMAAVLAVVYRFAPDRKQAQWRWISWGSAAATGLWLLTSLALFAYVQGLGTYESTYGSLAGVAISMFWLWISVVLVLLGAALNAEAERQTVHDSTVGSEKPPGHRGAVVADDVPPHADEPAPEA